MAGKTFLAQNTSRLPVTFLDACRHPLPPPPAQITFLLMYPHIQGQPSLKQLPFSVNSINLMYCF